MSAHDDRHLARTAANTARFRRVNDDIASKAYGPREASVLRLGFICECSISECTDEVLLTLGEYQRLRANGNHFIVCPDHIMPMGDRVVDRHPRYWIIEKFDHARRFAEAETAHPTGERGQFETVGLVRAVQAARWQESEYVHATDHYVLLMRHRLANPLTSISGLVQTLVDLPDLDRDARIRILQTIEQQCHELLNVNLDPRRTGDEEHELEAEPFRRATWSL
ncbi:MAG: hypothetical protein JWM98_3313 [Thermoleophilia bacterium]|nr:hypothetical protein [Thermoleophilia bacterium]